MQLSETPQLELKSLPSFLAIKCCHWTNNQNFINLNQSSSKKLAHICTNSGYPVKLVARIIALQLVGFGE
jgi:hypothetical protein